MICFRTVWPELVFCLIRLCAASRHQEDQNPPVEGFLKRTLTAAELADTLSSPNSFERCRSSHIGWESSIAQ